jgi:TonB-dependent receptor
MTKAMNRILSMLFFVFCCVQLSYATKIKGKVLDQQTGEAVPGASITLLNSGKTALTGLDGSFEIKGLSAGAENIRISFVSYETIQKSIQVEKEGTPEFVFYLVSNNQRLMEVTIKGTRKAGADDPSARRMERNASQIMNVVSSRAIEISPDLTVANVMQRVSGVSIERSSNGEGQYALIRGMDKRYNTTLVNGVKMPSPDNKYRYVPLDLFPSDMLERLEVYKSLTPNMEADAIGGVVNMVMKTAPAKRQIDANFALGYNQQFFDHDFGRFDASAIKGKSPYERNGRNYNATQSDFSKGTLDYTYKRPIPDMVGNITFGERFLDQKLGLIVGASYQNMHRGGNSEFYNSAVAGTDAFAVITNKVDRTYSEQLQRLGLHGKLDYQFNPAHKISFYNMFVNLENQQLREGVTTTYNSEYKPQQGNAELVFTTRSRLTKQQIYNGTLQGDHNFVDDRLKLRWSAVYSSARNEVPQNTLISLNGLQENFVQRRTSLVNTAPVTYRWERNTDEDIAGYWDLAYRLDRGDGKLELSTGGLYRDKRRSSFYNNYILSPSATDAHQIYGVDFERYTDLNLVVRNPNGAVSNPLTYDASEKLAAIYGMFNYQNEQFQAIGGIRMEHTNQGYNLLFTAGEKSPTGKQVYVDWLPSLTLKYHLTKKSQLHGAYYRALNRPGFYEIVPSKVVNEEFQERGNPDIKRAIADNFDLRYELFPEASEQLMVGAFYKSIQNPIEYTFQADAIRGQDIYYSPGNFGNAKNYGLEVDFIKYFSRFGVKANYTYTHSAITTPKTARRINSQTGDIEAYFVDQKRPLYGQSAHIANVALLFKDAKNGIDAQLAMAYTGPRIHTVSQFLDNDLWQKGFANMDASAEKQFRHGWAVFAKANNLLNTPMKLFIKGTNPENDKIAEGLVSNGQTLIRKDLYGQNYLIGVRYKFNK